MRRVSFALFWHGCMAANSGVCRTLEHALPGRIRDKADASTRSPRFLRQAFDEANQCHRAAQSREDDNE